MQVFIDDSGDAGFKLNRGSSKIFVISAVIFDDELEAEKTALAIKELKRELKFPDEVEFKFNKSSKKVRMQFLEAVNKYEFKVRSIVIDKQIIHSEELINNKNSFYSYAIKSLLNYSGNAISNAKIKIDGSGDKLFRKNFLTYLRKNLNSSNRIIIKSCKLIDSKKNVLIQLADMIAGSVRRSYDHSKMDSKIYKSIIQKHIDDEWNFK
ncbi:DUF3800 domain-containing protein [bacterium]|nr:MAG: DUF3800 domain-containing protein [bacterium]